MPKFEKGNDKSIGRPKGSVNKSTKEVRAMFATLLENNLQTAQNKLDLVGRENPAAYLSLLLKIAEYSIPKLTGVQQIQVLEPQTYTIGFTE